MYTRLKHLDVLVSYTATLAAVNKISSQHQVPVSEWLERGLDVKFIGDNVDKKQGVCDHCSDKKTNMLRMYSLLAVKSRVLS